MKGVLSRSIRGIRDSIPAGYMLGRQSSGDGPVELIHVSNLASQLAATGRLPAPSSSGGGGLTNPEQNLEVGMPALSTFTQVNVTNKSSIVENSGKAFSIIDAGTNSFYLTGVSIAIPTAPYRLAMYVQMNFNLSSAAQSPGFVWGFTDGTKLDTARFSATTSGSALQHETWATATDRASYSNIGVSTGFYFTRQWFALHDDGAGNVIWENSDDGANFMTCQKIAKSSGYLGSSGYTNLFAGIVQESYSVSLRCWDPNGLTRKVPA